MSRELDDSMRAVDEEPKGSDRAATDDRAPMADTARRRTVRSTIGFALVGSATLAIAAWFGPPPAPVSAAPASGEQLYTQHCAACHQPGGVGLEGTFPPLAGNPAAADPAYVETVIREGVSGPLEVLGVSYDAEMPPVAGLTDADQIGEVTRYVTDLASATTGGQDDETEQSDPTEAGTGDEGDADGDGASSGQLVGDSDRGHDLFIGAARFENGGAACAACHTAGSVGNLGGQSLGPSLTDAFDTLGGEAGLTGWMANPPSATMQPLFADRPLTETELADVVAFLGTASTADEPDTTVDRLLLAGIAGLAVLIVGMALVWRGMRQTYRDRLRSRPTSQRRRSGRAGPTPPTRGRTNGQRQTAETATTARSSR